MEQPYFQYAMKTNTVLPYILPIDQVDQQAYSLIIDIHTTFENCNFMIEAFVPGIEAGQAGKKEIYLVMMSHFLPQAETSIIIKSL